MRLFLSILFLIALQTISLGQVPQKFTYQAVATDNQGNELANQTFMVKALVVRNSANGTPQWIENHNVTTDEFGLFTIDVGSLSNDGGVMTSFADIPWGDDLFFLRIEMDLTNSGTFTFVGVKPLNSVPYALYSAGADEAKTALDETDSAEEIARKVLVLEHRHYAEVVDGLLSEIN